MALVTLTGQWVAPDLTARAGRIVATLLDPVSGAASVAGSAAGHLDPTGTLPTTGTGALRVTAPPSGSVTYVIRERLANVDEQQYRIRVAHDDTTIDLTTR